MSRQRAIEQKLTRRRGLSMERREALTAHNASQEYRGICRICKAPWYGLMKDMPKRCPGCGAPDGD